MRNRRTRKQTNKQQYGRLKPYHVTYSVNNLNIQYSNRLAEWIKYMIQLDAIYKKLSSKTTYVGWK